MGVLTTVLADAWNIALDVARIEGAFVKGGLEDLEKAWVLNL
jgi:hypothetical protein